MSDTQYEANDDAPPLTDLTRMWWEIIVDDWGSRTTYGRLWFPVWLALSAFQWLVAGTIVTIVMAFFKWDKALTKGCKEGRRLTPSIYDDEETEECETS